MVDKKTNFSKTRCCIRIINLTASICFVITPILRIMYRGFPAFETINDHLDVRDYISNPLPIKPPKNVKRQIYTVAKQVPGFQQGVLHKIISSKVALICIPEDGLYTTLRKMEVFKIVQEAVVLQKFQDPIPIMGILKGPNWYILGMRMYCLALEKGNLITWEWLRLNARYVDFLKKARPVFSVDCVFYLPMWSNLLRGVFNYLSFLALTAYVCLRYNLECIEWLVTKSMSGTKEVTSYFLIPIEVFLDRTKNFRPSLFPIIKDTVKIIGSKYHEFIKEGSPIIVDCGRISLLDLYTLNNKILPIAQKKVVFWINILTKIGLTSSLKVNLILLNYLFSKTKIIKLLYALKFLCSSTFIQLTNPLITEIKIVTPILAGLPTVIEFLNPKLKILGKYVKTSNITLTDLYTPINKKSIHIRNRILIQQSQLVIQYLRHNLSSISGFLSKEKKLKLATKYLKKNTKIISYFLEVKKTKNRVLEFVKIKTPVVKQFVEIKTPILVNYFNDSSQVFIIFLKKMPIIRARSRPRDLTEVGVVDIVASKMQLDLNIINLIIKETLTLIEFLKAKMRLVLQSIILDIPTITQFVILDTPTTLEFIKVKLPGITDLLTEKTNFRLVHEFLQKNVQILGILLSTIKVFSLKRVVKILLRPYLLILLAEIYLILDDRSPLILILNIMINRKMSIRLLSIGIKIAVRLIDVGCELVIMWIHLFPGMVIITMTLETWIMRALGFTYGPEYIQMQDYIVLIKYATFYYAEYLGFFKTFPFNGINGIIKND